MVILDLSIVNVALPSIQDTLNFTTSQLQWVIDAYAITFAGFLMLGGRAADHFGQRRIFVVALACSRLASLAGGLAPDRVTLIVARGAQGLGGALMAASSLAIITSSFPPGPQLHRAIGIWGAMNGLGGAAGVLFGGIITETISWRWVLLINPPIGIAAALVAFAVVVDRKREHGAPSFDLAGAITLTARPDHPRLRNRRDRHRQVGFAHRARSDLHRPGAVRGVRLHRGARRRPTR